jgi:hypothetical protein
MRIPTISRRKTGLTLLALSTAFAVAAPSLVTHDGQRVAPAAETNATCSPAMQDVWRTGIAQFTTAPCTVPSPITIDPKKLPQPQSEADRCWQNQLMTLLAANEEAGQAYRARLLKELLDLAAFKAASSMADPNRRPDLATLIKDSTVTPLDIAQAMGQALTDMPEVDVTLASCGPTAEFNQGGNKVFASQKGQLNPPKVPSGAAAKTPSKLIDYLRALVDYLRKNVSKEFRASVTVGVSATLSRTGKATTWRTVITANFNSYFKEWLTTHPSGLQQDAQKAFDQEIRSVTNAVKGIGIANVGTSTGHAEEVLINAEQGNTDADVVFVAATNNICADTCQPKIQGSTLKVIPVTPLSDVPADVGVDFWGTPIVAKSRVDLWSLAKLRNKIENASLVQQGRIIGDLNTIIKTNSTWEAIWKAVQNYNDKL